jgi:hypothetical protein
LVRRSRRPVWSGRREEGRERALLSRNSINPTFWGGRKSLGQVPSRTVAPTRGIRRPICRCSIAADTPQLFSVALWDTRTTSGLMNPQFSPNGRKTVAFGGARTDRVWTMRADDSHKRKLTRGTTGGLQVHPQWSPNGKKIAYERIPKRGPAILRVMRGNGSHKHSVAPARV